MATWKKVAVSGSNISQFNNDSGYLTSVAASPNSYATASINGVELLASSPTSSFNLVTGSAGTGLTISGSVDNDTITVNLSSIPNATLANDSVTIGSTEVDLGATAATVAGLTLTGATVSGSFTGSFVGTFVGTTDLPDLTDGNGITDFTYDGSSTATVALDLDGSTLSVGASGVKIADNGVTGTQINTSVAGTGLSGGGGSALSVDYGSSAGDAVEGNTTITLTQTANEIDITGTAAQALGGGPSYTIGLADTISGNRTFSGDTITINNDLIVQGTASFQQTTNLEVADRFVLFASGSSSTGDGGIVVQQATQNVGELFGYDSGTTRWGVTSSFSASTAAYAPDAFMAAVTTLSSTNPNTSGPASRYNAVGNVYVSSGDASIWIYS